MDIQLENIYRAYQGHTRVPSDWVTPSSFRPIVYEDEVQLWLKHHGNKHGFNQNDSQYSMLSFLSKKGHEFEEKYIEQYFPQAVYALQPGESPNSFRSFFRTVELMRKDTPAIAQAVIFWGEDQVWGIADLLVKADVLWEVLPNAKPKDWAGPNTYIVCDTKFTGGLEAAAKKTDLRLYSLQVQLYSHIVAKLTQQESGIAFLITKDKLTDPIAVTCPPSVNRSLSEEIKKLRDRVNFIKHECADILPWDAGSGISVNAMNHHDEPWSAAKRKILWELTSPTPLERLPYLGKKASHLRDLGFASLEDLLAIDSSNVPLEEIKGLSADRSARIRLLLEANRSNKISWPTKDLIAAPVSNEYFIDLEFGTPINIKFKKSLDQMEATSIIFMAGVGYVERGEWCYQQFTAAHETYEAEREMLKKMLEWFKKRGVLSDPNAVLWHWSSAEKWQCAKAADRAKLPELAHLPLQDLAIIAEKLAIPGVYDNKLKSVAKALGHAWPALDGGGEAMIQAFAAYEQPKPLETQLMKDVGIYLQADVKALWVVLEKMRAAADGKSAAKPEKVRRTASWWPQIGGLPLIPHQGKCWYRLA